MRQKPKYHLIVQRDKINQWFTHETHGFRLHLCGDPRKGGYWLSQYAKKLGKEHFMRDFTEILAAMEKDQKAAFTLYEK